MKAPLFDTQAMASRWRIFTDLSPRIRIQITSIGLVLVLIVLTGFAVWGTIATRSAAAHAIQASEVSDLYQQARAAVAAEESIERKYRLEPSPEVAATHRAAGEDLVNALETVRASATSTERVFVDEVLATHTRYLDAVGRMFAEIDAGNTAQVLEIDNNETDPAFSIIEMQVDQAATTYHEQALQALRDLDQLEGLVFSATPIVFTVGLVLLAFFWNILRSLQNSLELANRRDADREIERIKSDVERDKALIANRAKSAFLATMSHELRTPLTAILGYTELIQMQIEQRGYQELAIDIAQIKTSGMHLLSLINDVLDFSKIEAGKAQLDLQQIDLHEMISDLVLATQPLVTKNGNHLRLAVAQNLDSMHTDGTKLRQVMLNLLSNAAKFTQQGEIVLRVEQAQHENRPCIQITVSDNGIGMSAEQIQRLFQPFTQADASTTRKYGGTGLGLALCRHLCELLGGQIIVESVLGVGSSFIVTLPTHLGD